MLAGDRMSRLTSKRKAREPGKLEPERRQALKRPNQKTCRIWARQTRARLTLPTPLYQPWYQGTLVWGVRLSIHQKTVLTSLVLLRMALFPSSRHFVMDGIGITAGKGLFPNHSGTEGPQLKERTKGAPVPCGWAHACKQRQEETRPRAKREKSTGM